MTTRQYYWHIHHEILCEALTEPIQNRIDHIKKFKDPSEVETRLRCMTPVLHPERLPVEWTDVFAKLDEARAKRDEARAKWDEAFAKLSEASAKWDEARAKSLPQMEALHKEEHPGCPWDGHSIFKERVA